MKHKERNRGKSGKGKGIEGSRCRRMGTLEKGMEVRRGEGTKEERGEETGDGGRKKWGREKRHRKGG